MTFKSKSLTPIAAPIEDTHPCSKLEVGNAEQIATLRKFQPITLANHVSNSYQSETLVKLRTEYSYIYVINWIYNFRGYVKLGNDPFDVDIFELELLHYFPHSNLLNYDDTNAVPNTFVNKLRSALMSVVQKSKLSSLNNFENVFRLWFGYGTALGGTDDEEIVEEDNNDITFDQLSLSEKFEILHILIARVSKSAKFRDWAEKLNLSLTDLRITPLYSELTDTTERIQEDYFLVFDCNRLYKRTIQYNSLVIPKKRKLGPEDPKLFFEPEHFDIKQTVEFELVFKNIYEYNDVLLEFGEKYEDPKFNTLYGKLTKSFVIDSIFTSEIRKRKYITNKRKEIQLESLLATRKRSSRLEAKEHKKQEEEDEQRKQEEFELNIGSEKRMERRRKLRLVANGIYNDGLTRDDRLKQRKLAEYEVAEADNTIGHHEEAIGNVTPLVSGVLTEIAPSIAPAEEAASGVAEIAQHVAPISGASEAIAPEIPQIQSPLQDNEPRVNGTHIHV